MSECLTRIRSNFNMLTITLDWLTITFKEMTHESVEFTSLYTRAPKVQDSAPRFGYTSAITDANGVVSMWNADRPEMGYHVIFAGSALRNIFEYCGVSQRGLVQAVSDAGGHITRLDLAKDLEGVLCNLENVYSAVKKGDNRGACRTVSRLDSGTNGTTIYLGSRQSEKFARIYNKASQLNLEGIEWKRYELELKGMVARAMGSLLVDTDNWFGCFDAMASGMVDLPRSKDYQKFFQEGETLVGIPQIEKKTDREKWIEEQVISAVCQHFYHHPDSEAIKRLISSMALIERQRGGELTWEPSK